jgi:glycine betaine/proline transport system ATP-binding protein
MSMVFQSFALLPHINVIDNAAFGLELSAVPRATRYERALAALDQVGLKTYADSYPDELSGGMKTAGRAGPGAGQRPGHLADG